MSLLDLAKDKIGAKNGLDSKGAFGVIAMPPKDKDDEHAAPTPVPFVAVTDYKAILGNFEPEKKDEKISEVQVAGQAAVMAEPGWLCPVCQDRRSQGSGKRTGVERERRR